MFPFVVSNSNRCVHPLRCLLTQKCSLIALNYPQTIRVFLYRKHFVHAMLPSNWIGQDGHYSLRSFQLKSSSSGGTDPGTRCLESGSTTFLVWLGEQLRHSVHHSIALWSCLSYFFNVKWKATTTSSNNKGQRYLIIPKLLSDYREHFVNKKRVKWWWCRYILWVSKDILRFTQKNRLTTIQKSS